VLVSEEKVSSYRARRQQAHPKLLDRLDLQEDEIKEISEQRREDFSLHLFRSNYEREWGKGLSQTQPGERFLAFLSSDSQFGPLKISSSGASRDERCSKPVSTAKLDRYGNLTEVRRAVNLPNQNLTVERHCPENIA